jgi:transcriptional regulator with XRE-family HTH domain
VSPARRLEQTNIRTPLAEWRVKRGMTQRELWQAAGVSRTVYLKLERGDYQDPPLRRLNNCALVLGVELDELIQPEWREWWRPLKGDPAPPEDPAALWRQR